MNTQQIIAYIDAEIARLHEARRLLVQAAEAKRAGRGAPSGKLRKEPAEGEPQRKKRSVAARSKVVPAPHQPAALRDPAGVPVLRVPAKEAPKRRIAKAARREQTALSAPPPESSIVAAPRKIESKESATNEAAASDFFAS